MSKRGVVIFGSGKRVRETALPAFARAQEDFTVQRVFARTEKQIDVDGEAVDVASIDALTASDLRDAQLVYLAVTKDAVPKVLRRLADMGVSELDVLIDTPVVRFKHFRHAQLLSAFRNAWVAEDCSVLPWFDTVHAAVDAGAIGRFERVVFFQSAYAYHAVATAKALLRTTRVTRGSRHAFGSRFGTRQLRFAGGQQALVFEPRDYPSGRLLLLGSEGSISDYPYARDGNLVLEPVVRPLEPGTGNLECTGFRIGATSTELTAAERALAQVGTRGSDPAASVTARMDDMKRVGFLRLLQNIAGGRGAYPVAEALDDMAVDYHLEKLGRYVANPLTSPRFASGRFVLGSVSRLGG